MQPEAAASRPGKTIEFTSIVAYEAQSIGLTGQHGHDILCLLVPFQMRSSVRLERESGANPELPRSGRRKQKSRHALGCQGPGKQRRVGGFRSMNPGIRVRKSEDLPTDPALIGRVNRDDFRGEACRCTDVLGRSVRRPSVGFDFLCAYLRAGAGA